jgi:hypothetical protein
MLSDEDRAQALLDIETTAALVRVARTPEQREQHMRNLERMTTDEWDPDLREVARKALAALAADD